MDPEGSRSLPVFFRESVVILLALVVGSVFVIGGESGAREQAVSGRTGEPTTAIVSQGLQIPIATAEPSGPAEVRFSDAVDRESVALNRSEDLNLSGHYDEVRVAEDGTKHLIPLNAIEWGGVSRDGIPSLDRPSYVGPDRWDQMVYDPDGLVIGVEVDGKYRAYPLQILIWHEIINETFEGKHLLVTY